MDLNRGNHSVYLLNYHLIIVVKYRRKCITPEIREFLVKESARLLEEKWEGSLIEGNTDLDHIHLLVSLNPKYAISPPVGSLKNTLARSARKKYGNHIKKYLWKEAFWAPSYYITTVGDLSVERVQEYIESQGRPRRKYTRKGNSSPAQ